MQWIKEVELADSVDDLRSSSSVRSIPMPDFEVLDARIASALNKIIHNSHFKKKISLEEQKAQKEDRFLRGRQIAFLIYKQFRVTGTDSSVENNTNLFLSTMKIPEMISNAATRTSDTFKEEEEEKVIVVNDTSVFRSKSGKNDCD